MPTKPKVLILVVSIVQDLTWYKHNASGQFYMYKYLRITQIFIKMTQNQKKE